jgi:hypothetical protein
MHTTDNLIGAITQLVNGKTIYIVDSIGLTEDELILLHKKHALTRDGIRRYLVGRDLVPRAA